MSRETEARDTARQLGDFVNPYGYDAASFIEEICYRTHRTLQQSIGNLVFNLIKKWAECYDSKMYDGRNEDLCRKCKEIDTIMTDKNDGLDWTYLPTV